MTTLIEDVSNNCKASGPVGICRGIENRLITVLASNVNQLDDHRAGVKRQKG